jgi:hypothetical protein
VTSLFAEWRTGERENGKGMSLKRIFLICESFEERGAREILGHPKKKQQPHNSHRAAEGKREPHSNREQRATTGEKNNICFFEEESGCMYVYVCAWDDQKTKTHTFTADFYCRPTMHFSLCCVSATWISLLLFLFFSSL